MRQRHFLTCQITLSHRIHLEGTYVKFALKFCAPNFTSQSLFGSKSICFHLALAYFCFQFLAPQLSLLGEQDFPNGAFPFFPPAARWVNILF